MRRTGFTFVELLVIVAVIALLVGILLPVLSTARQQATAVVCASNIKHLALALTTYEQENGTFPPGFDNVTFTMVAPPGGYAGNASYDRQGWWWFHFLTTALNKDFERGSILWCPSRSVNDPSIQANILCGNYAVNRAICRDAASMGTEFVGKP
ncbi:MAG: type II secretion system protein, partial [Planctomycetota bacterium]